MPELPEVETTRRGLITHIVNKTITDVIVRNHQLRWPISHNFADSLIGRKLEAIDRRAKYLIFSFTPALSLLAHLGMSGSMRCLSVNTPEQKHDHVDIIFSDKTVLRYNDPRRFGALLLSDASLQQHKLLCHLGIEPDDPKLTGDYLKKRLEKKHTCIKSALMDQTIVAGLGNIYVCEALYLAQINPLKSCQDLTSIQLDALAKTIKQVIKKAIQSGGTTLKDFMQPDGKPGYFKQSLFVYGRTGEHCTKCGTSLATTRINNRATVYCPLCQI